MGGVLFLYFFYFILVSRVTI
uniref:Uncharacterized protein n=1 Tax=Anguilla anguilla TaxID=7936 RepID=A0A0E9UJM4_ANGAN